MPSEYNREVRLVLWRWLSLPPSLILCLTTLKPALLAQNLGPKVVPQLVPGVSKQSKSNAGKPGLHIGFYWQRWPAQSGDGFLQEIRPAYLGGGGGGGGPSPLPSQVDKLLQEFPGLINPGNDTPCVKHGVWHVIKTMARPVFAKACRLYPIKLKTAKEEFRKFELAGIICRSDSPWASPLHMVQKSNGYWRPCGDYRRLNNITTLDRYPLPNMQDLGTKLAGCRVFSHLDLIKG